MPCSARSSSTCSRAQRQHREHALLLVDISEPRIVAGEPGAQSSGSARPSPRPRTSHSARSSGSSRMIRATAAPMIGRHRPHGPRQAHQIAEGDRPRRAALDALDEEGAEPVAIAAEILVAALRDERLLGRLDDQPRARRIGLEAVAEALIGEIDERDQAARRDQFGDRAPLVEVEIGAGRIVAAAVEKDEIARLAPRRARPSSRRSGSSGCPCRNKDRRPSRRRPRRSEARDWARSARRR